MSCPNEDSTLSHRPYNMVKPYPILLLAGLTLAHQCPPSIQIDHKPQIFVMSDISNEPDDTQSFIRLLLHSDQYNITGMVATTSYWLNSTTTPDEILKLTTAYGQVVENLNRHSAGEFPTEEYLSSIVKSGHPVYGTAAIGKPLSSGAERLIETLICLAINVIDISLGLGFSAQAKDAREKEIKIKNQSSA